MSPDWKAEPLDNVATLQRGFDLPYRQRKIGLVPIVTSSGTGETHSEAKVSGPGVVTGRYGTIGKVFYIQSEFWPLNTTLYVRDFHGNDPLFVSYMLRTIDFDSHSGKSGVPGVNRNDLHKLIVSLPTTLLEQQAIATALSDADAFIAGLEVLLGKKRDLKTATMQQLLTGKTRLEGFGNSNGFKQTEIGEIPNDWQVIPLGNLFEITSSKRVFQSQWKAEGIPFYRARELAVLAESGFVKNELFITKEMYNLFRSNFGVPKSDDILVTGVGTLGKVYVVPKGAEFYFKDGNIIWFQISETIVAEFLRQLYLTRVIIKQIEDGSAGTTVGTYTISGAKKTIVPFPSHLEQQAIATVLSDMDAEIASLEAQLLKARDVKQGMMQELLTGRIRLV
jgi:type I restriction enzyme, S subunit